MATQKKEKLVQYTNKAGKTFAVKTTDSSQKGISGYYEGNKKYETPNKTAVAAAKVTPTYYDTQYTNKMGKTYDVKTTQKPVTSGVSSQADVANNAVSDAGAAQQEDAVSQGQTALDPNNYDYNKYYYSEQTGQWYDKGSGKGVDIYGNAPEAGTMTDKERIKAQADIPFGDLEKTGADLFGEDNPYKDKGSFEKAILEKFKTESKEDEQYLTEQQQRQRELDLAQLKDAERSGKASAAGAEASLSQGREGIQSIDRPTVITEYKQAIQRDMDQATKRFDMAEASRRRALVELERAKENGERDIVQMWQQNLQRAEMEIEQSRTAMMDAQARNVSLALDINADQRAAQQQSIANFNAFSGLVEQGVTLTPDNILGFSKSLSIPFEDAYSYYQGMQSIRDDKTLTMEQKALETQNLQQDFNDRMTGYQTKEAQKLRDYTRLVQSGQYTAEEAAVMLGISNDKNPIYQAEKRLAEATARIKENEANGIITNPLEILEQAKLAYEVGELYGTNGVYVPNGSIKSTPVAGGLMVNVENGLKGYSCGEFVNKVTGQTVGNTYQQKLDKMRAMGGSMIPAAGMVFVSSATGKYAPWGHVGIVERVNADGTVDIVDSNYSGPNTVGRRKGVAITNFDGFYAPAGASVVGGKKAGSVLSSLSEKVVDNVRAEASSFRQEPIVKDYNTILNKKLSVQSIIDAGVGGPGDLALVFEFMKALDPASVVKETEYETARKSGNIFAGAFAKYNGYLKEQGGFLPDQVKKDFKELVDLKMSSSQAQYDNLYDQYANRVNNLAGGLDVASEIMTDYSSISKTKAPSEVSDEDFEEALSLSVPGKREPSSSVLDAIKNLFK